MLRERLGRDARAVVAHAHPALGAGEILAGRHLDARLRDARALERVERVADQVDQHAAQLLGVAAQRAVGADLHVERDAARARAIAQRRDGGGDHVGEAEIRHADLLLAREAQQVRDGALDAVELLERHLRVLDVLARRRILAHLLHQALRRRDRVADLVRDRGRELLERAHVARPRGARRSRGALCSTWRATSRST